MTLQWKPLNLCRNCIEFIYPWAKKQLWLACSGSLTVAMVLCDSLVAGPVSYQHLSGFAWKWEEEGEKSNELLTPGSAPQCGLWHRLWNHCANTIWASVGCSGRTEWWRQDSHKLALLPKYLHPKFAASLSVHSLPTLKVFTFILGYS